MNESVSTRPTPERESNTLVNAVIGGVVSIVLGFVPFSPVLGGALAGYLQGTNRSAGLRVGAYAGLVAAVPFAIIAFLIVSVFAFVPVASGGSEAAGAGLLLFVVVLFVLFVALVYGVGLSALGGYLGAYLKEEGLN